jgi:hypothetical protein
MEAGKVMDTKKMSFFDTFDLKQTVENAKEDGSSLRAGSIFSSLWSSRTRSINHISKLPEKPEKEELKDSQ